MIRTSPLRLATLALLALPALPLHAQAAAVAPAAAAPFPIEAEARTFVTGMIRDLTAIDTREKDPATRVRALDAALTRHVALDRIGRFLLGASRAQATPAELAAYDKAVPAYILADVRGEIGKLVAQSLVVDKVQARSNSDALVRSQFRRKTGGLVRVDWRVIRGSDGALKLADVYVNGVSRFVIRRDEFQAVVKSGGMPALLKLVSAPAAPA
jgi:ABC-type transporter MlaC component